jgi:hypothetical protein
MNIKHFVIKYKFCFCLCFYFPFKDSLKVFFNNNYFNSKVLIKRTQTLSQVMDIIVNNRVLLIDLDLESDISEDENNGINCELVFNNLFKFFVFFIVFFLQTIIAKKSTIPMALIVIKTQTKRWFLMEVMTKMKTF